MSHEEDFGFRNSQYERPNQKWVCGRQAEGNGCNRGPDGRGQCQTFSECEPYKDGDRWHCNRPFTSGGKCEQGPLADGQCCLSRPPCKPRVSQRTRRGRVVMASGFLGLMVLAALFLAGSDNAFFSPGPLTSGHANIGSCQECHGQASLFPSDHASDPSLLCADCHEFSTAPLQAHNMSFTATAGDLASTGTTATEHECRSCHQEHDGDAALQMAKAGQSCSGCHTEALEFPRQHPAFNNLAARPVALRAIAFDHATHQNRHFPDQDQATFECAQCHVPKTSSAGDLALQPFEQSCSDCHQSDVTGEFFDAGLMLWSIPAIDPDRLGGTVELPEAVYDEQAFVSPVQVWLLNKLGSAPEQLEAMVNFDLNPLDTEDFTASQKRQVEYYVKESQALLGSLRNPNDRPTANEPAIEALLAQLSPKQMQTAEAHWFEDQPLPDDAPYYGDLTDGGTFIRGFTLRYRPSGHADPLLKALIEDLVINRANANAVDQLLLQDLLSEEMAGQCGRCHQVDRQVVDANDLWTQTSSASPLTLFSHRPHMPPLADQQCVDCHTIDLEEPQHDFGQMDIQQCGDCHQKGKVENDCLQCHKYHAHPKTDD